MGMGIASLGRREPPRKSGDLCVDHAQSNPCLVKRKEKETHNNVQFYSYNGSTINHFGCMVKSLFYIILPL